jgi:acetyl esterase/lipase
MPATNVTVQKKDNKGIFSRALLLHREKVLESTPESAFTIAKNVEIDDITVQISSEKEMPARIIRPKTVPDNGLYPTLFYIPGTAFIAYENKYTNIFCSHIAEQAKCQVIILYHALAPEYKFPQGYKDVQALFTYFVKTVPDDYKIDVNKVAISGYSSGGNFAALLAIYAKEKNIPFNRQILISPVVDLSRTISRLPQYHALRQYEEKDKAISAEFVAWFIDLYIPSNLDPQLH